MEWLNEVPAAIWQAPIQVLVIILLSLGVFVTKREHGNMTEMMKHYRQMSENKDETILNQAKTIEVLNNELGPLVKEVLQGVRIIAREKGKGDV